MTPSQNSGRQISKKGSTEEMRALLANYVRYATLVRSQEEALEEEDLDRFQDLAEAREAIQEEMGTVPPSFPEEEELDAESRQYLERIYENFRDTLLRDTRLRARLQQMKKDASQSLTTVEGRGRQLKGYLAREEDKTGEGSSRLNVRF